VSSIEWPAVSAIASAIAALIALASSLVALCVARTHVRLADFNNSLEVRKQLAEAERKAAETTGDQQAHEIRALLNLFEVLALLVNRRQVGRSSRYLIEGYLIETWVWLETTPSLSGIVAEAITGPRTFEQLQEFKARNRAQIVTQIAKRREGAA
jgi:hypothetical protein